ncbi:MAG: ATP-binding protein [Proteobacteria bacterium]|nr:ATP-binding protein [Pseudomonadota bacterium]
MHPYVAIPLLSSVICSALAFCFLAAESRMIPRSGAALFAAAALWALGQVGWNLSADVATAELWMRATSPGWTFIGPLTITVLWRLAGRRSERAWVLPALYGVSALLTLSVLATPWTMRGMAPVSWGYVWVPGPLFLGYYAYTIACVLVGFHSWLGAVRGESRFTWGTAQSFVTGGILIPIFLASSTDVFLPFFGVYAPSFGTASFALLSLVILWGVSTRGYLFATAEVFAFHMLKALPDGVALVRWNGEIAIANAGLGRLLGSPPDELEGRSLSTFAPTIVLKDAAGLRNVECELHPLSGDPIPVSLSVSVLSDRTGRPAGLVLVARDLREIVRLRRHVMTSDRLAAVGQLAAGIAHEINNPLAFVHANLGVLREQWDDVAEALRKEAPHAQLARLLGDGDEIISESLEGVDRAVAIVRDVRDLSHVGDAVGELSDLNHLLEQVLRVAATEKWPDIEIIKDYGQLPPIHCAPQQLKQVFLNLLVNALQAVGDQGVVCLRTEHKGDSVSVTVTDDGPGIPPEQQDRIFDPFFTTKVVGEGTGLGLAISYEIVRNHGGELSVESTPAQGTRFCVVLPLRAADALNPS